jgi:K(+)-stimulated pyrophosphate-energized sodium pump
MLGLTLGISVIGLVFAFLLARFVLQEGTGTEAMRAISDAIKEGAEAFLRRQYKTIGYLALMVAVLIYVLYAFAKGDPDEAWRTTVAFLFGAFCSALAGYIGMYISIRANIRTANAVQTSMDRALKISFRGGAVSGVTIVAVSLLGIVLLFVLYGGQSTPEKVPFLIVGYGFGASFVALFAQLGGGIYTKAADVGADLVGKVEAGIPEDDPLDRRPAALRGGHVCHGR